MEEKEKFEIKVIQVRRVVHVRAGGKKLRFRALVAIGNKNGKVGVGVDSATDVSQAIEKAVAKAKKNLIQVPIVDDTIPAETEAKYCSAQILLKPQRKGRGLVVGGVARIICELAGIKDISGKFLSRTPNKINNAFATFEALKKLTQYYAIPSNQTET